MSHTRDNWLTSLFRVWRREFYLVFHDLGVMLFFFALPLFYPIVYTLIYNPELIRDMPIAVVDHSRTAPSRELARMVDATDGLKVYQYAPDMEAARRMMNRKEVYGILEIPAGYARQLGRGEQANVTYYADVSLLLRYRQALFNLTDLQMAIATRHQQEKIASGGLLLQDIGGSPIDTQSVMMGDPTQGFASFIMPGVLVLILHQSLILGVAMLAGGSAERRRRNGGLDPMSVDAPASATLIGKTLCYTTIYTPMALYALHFVPWMFTLPHLDSMLDSLVYILPMTVAASMLGFCVASFVTEREASLMVVVFTSVVFLFLSGLTWPRYAMGSFWQLVGGFIPATWGIEGFIRLNSNGATFAQQSHPAMMLWGLAALYFAVAWILTRRFGLFAGARRTSPRTV